jgi:hypothetical protein
MRGQDTVTAVLNDNRRLEDEKSELKVRWG